MARIGVVTIHDLGNIGNRLQNYALTHVLESMGHQVVSLPNQPYDGVAARAAADARPMPEEAAPHQPPVANGSPVRRLAVRAGQVARTVRAKLAGKQPRDFVVLARKQLRTRALTAFSAEHVDWDPRPLNAPGDGERLAGDYDFFVVGSDQVWNPNYRGACPTDFLQFADPAQRVAYAASFGVEELDEIRPERQALIAEMAASIPAVSVREEAGARLFTELTGKPCPVVLDPTLLVEAAHWHEVADRGVTPSGTRPYVAVCLLARDTPSLLRGIRALAHDQGLQVRNLLGPRSVRPHAYGAESVLATLRGAQVVVTDSFHMTVFSLLFSRPLVLLRKDSTNDRLGTLLRTLQVDLEPVLDLPGVLPRTAPASQVDACLAAERDRSRQFLASALQSRS